MIDLNRRVERVRKTVLKALGFALVAGLVIAPTLLIAIEAILGKIHLGETFAGATVGSLFLGITALATVAFQNSPALRFAVLTSYVVKTLILVVIGFQFDFRNFNAAVLAASVTVSALFYATTQSVYITRTQRRKPVVDPDATSVSNVSTDRRS